MMPGMVKQRDAIVNKWKTMSAEELRKATASFFPIERFSSDRFLPIAFFAFFPLSPSLATAGGLERAANDRSTSTDRAPPPRSDTQQQVSGQSSSVDGILQLRTEVAVRQQEIEKRLEEIENELDAQ